MVDVIQYLLGRRGPDPTIQTCLEGTRRGTWVQRQVIRISSNILVGTRWFLCWKTRVNVEPGVQGRNREAMTLFFNMKYMIKARTIWGPSMWMREYLLVAILWIRNSQDDKKAPAARSFVAQVTCLFALIAHVTWCVFNGSTSLVIFLFVGSKCRYCQRNIKISPFSSDEYSVRTRRAVARICDQIFASASKRSIL